MNVNNIEQILEMQQDNYSRRIGTTFGTFRIDDVKYNWQAHTQEWVISCIKCGRSETVTHSVGWDWLRGKGRSRDKCNNCKRIEKESEKNEKIKKREELNAKLDSIVGMEINCWHVNSRNGSTYSCVCIKCGRERKLSYKQITEDNIICKQCDKMDFSDPLFIGKRYGNLTVLKHIGGNFVVKCDCGFEKSVKCSAVHTGKTITCGRLECEYHKNAMNYYGKHKELVREVGIKAEDDIYERLASLGYSVEKTKTAGDYGVDIIVSNGEEKTAVQVKNNNETKAKVGVHAVMEVYAGGVFYDCSGFIVISYTGYTDNAKNMAKKLGVILCDESCHLYDSSKDLPINTKYIWRVNGKDEPMLKTFIENGWGKNIGKFVGMEYEDVEKYFNKLQGKREHVKMRKESGVSQQLINYRMKKGMTFEQAINTPIKDIQGRPRKQGVSA